MTYTPLTPKGQLYLVSMVTNDTQFGLEFLNGFIIVLAFSQEPFHR